MYAYHTQLLQFARRLSKLFALALHMPEDYFDDYVKHPEAGMRIIHYPQQDAAPTDQNGIGAHTDFECFTIVTLDGNEGLEVLNKSGYWVKAKPVPDVFVVRILMAVPCGACFSVVLPMWRAAMSSNMSVYATVMRGRASLSQILANPAIHLGQHCRLLYEADE